MTSNIGVKLRELRLSRKLNQTRVAGLVGVDKRTISTYETGERQPSYDVLISFARLYHVTTDYLLGLDERTMLDVSGLTEDEIDVIGELVTGMKEKNKQLKRK